MFQVAGNLPEKQRVLADKVMECQHFIEQLDALTTWVKNTKELLETQQGPVGSVTDHDEQDSVVVDPTVNKHDDLVINSIRKLLINKRDYGQTPGRT